MKYCPHKSLLILFIFIASINNLKAQVGINTDDPKSTLDIQASASTTPDGLLIPRVTAFPINVTADQDGMLLFLSTNIVGYDRGFYFYDHGNGWMNVLNPMNISDVYVDNSGRIRPINLGSDLYFRTNERIILDNTTTTPDDFLTMYASNTGTNVTRTILTESPGSTFDLQYDPTDNAFLFKQGAVNKVAIDLDDAAPLSVLGAIELGNNGNQYTLPNTNGNTNEILQTDGSGTTSWTTWENADIGFWDEALATQIRLRTPGDDLFLRTNERIILDNTTTTPDDFLTMYASNSGTNVTRTILTESPGSTFDLQYDPTDNAFLFKQGAVNKVAIDLDGAAPLSVLGAIELGNNGNQYTLPSTNGNTNEILQTDGSGTTSWTTWENADIGFWDEALATQIRLRTPGDDLFLRTNERIILDNTTTTPDDFLTMYASNTGTNVTRTILTESPGSTFDLQYDPTDNAFLFKQGAVNKVAIDLDGAAPLSVLGAIELGNNGNQYTLPNTNGNTNEILQTDGSGTTSWTTWENADIGFWDETLAAQIRLRTPGDDLFLRTNERIILDNTTTTPDDFLTMYASNSGTNVTRTILTESPGSTFDLQYDPTDNAFLFKQGAVNKVAIDLDGAAPLSVLGAIELGNNGNQYTLPNTNGNTNEILQTDGSGTTSWTTWENADIGFWDETLATQIRLRTPGDDLFLRTNERIILDNTTTTPDDFLTMYTSNTGTNVTRTILTESPGSTFDLQYDPTDNAFLFKQGAVNKVAIDLDDAAPLSVLGAIELGNNGNQYTLPNTNGNTNEILQTDGSGTTSWTTWENADIGFWDETLATQIRLRTPGDDLFLRTNERIILDNTTTTPDDFLTMYASNSGTNVTRTILTESPGSTFDLQYDPTDNAFLFKQGAVNKVAIDLDDAAPLSVLGAIELGNNGNQYTLPNTNGNANEFLQTDGSGNTSWVTVNDPWSVNGNIIQSTSSQTVGINTTTTTSTIDVNGSVSMNIRNMASGTVADNDYTVIVSGSVSIPNANTTNTGRVYKIVMATGSNNITLTALGNDFTEPGGSNFSTYGLNTNAGGVRSITIQSDGASWYIIDLMRY